MGEKHAKETGANAPKGAAELPRGLPTLTLGGLCTRARAACHLETVQLGLGDARACLWSELELRLGLGFELRPGLGSGLGYGYGCVQGSQLGVGVGRFNVRGRAASQSPIERVTCAEGAVHAWDQEPHC